MTQQSLVDDGIFELGSEIANNLGFTKDKFFGYLWKKDDMIIISLVESLQPGKGNLSALFNTIWEAGYRIGVPTPLGKMVNILEKKGFAPTVAYSEEINEPYELWIK